MENLLWDDASTFNWSSNQLVISGGFDVDEVLIEGMNTSEASKDLGTLDQILESVNDTLDPDLFQLCSLPPVEDSGSENFPNLSSSTGNISSGESDNHDSHSKIVEFDRPMRKRKSGEFRIVFGDSKRPKSENCCSSIEFGRESGYEPDTEAIAQVKEMIYRAAALRPMSLGVREEAVERPKRKNVRISSDPQTVAARHRRERISERLRVLQRMVPGGSKMDTASMLDEAANYLKFLKSQVSALELAQGGNTRLFSYPQTPLHQALPMQSPFPLPRP